MNTTPPGTGPDGSSTQYQPPRTPWRLVRRERGRVLGGVATGMADAFHIDVVVMRVIWVVVALASFGVGVAAYAICWLAFPSDEHPAPLGDFWHDHNGFRVRNAGFIVGLALLGLGLIIVFGQVVRPFRHGGSIVWAAILIGAGLAVLLLRHPDDDRNDIPALPVPPSWTPRASTTPPTEPAPTADTDGDADADAATTPPAPSWEPPTTPQRAMPPIPPIPPSAWTQSAPWPTAPTPRVRKRRPRAFLTPVTCSLLLIGGGIVTLLDDNGTTHLTAAEILAGGLALVGLALVLSTWFGRARGLVPIGILLLIVTLPAATIDVPLSGGTGNHEYRPVARSEIRSRYEMGIGRLNVDLSRVPLTGRTTRVHAQLGIGEMIVDVPSTVRVVVHAHAGAGSVRLFGSNEGGWPERQTRTAPGTGAGQLDLDLRVGAGDIQVRRFDSIGAQTILPGAIR
jgi:phage shock protein PspC (stress-responsive transcriptional regulator)